MGDGILLREPCPFQSATTMDRQGDLFFLQSEQRPIQTFNCDAQYSGMQNKG
jgi:hypothetical protein